MTTLIAFDHAALGYGRRVVLSDITFDIPAGDFLGLVGPNGAGKTTLLSAVVGFLSPAKGSIAFDGRDITGMRTESIVRLGIGLVPEHRRLFRNLTVRENLEIAASGGDGEVEDRERLLERFPILHERSDQLAGYLSGGEAQQLAIARALVARPRLLLLDEPSLGLAPLIVDEVFRLIGELREQGTTILLVEQNAYHALEVADRAYVMRTGELEGGGPADALLDEQELLRAYLGGGV
jgi:branched-chain amino acid transport system ATP-binding protein